MAAFPEDLVTSLANGRGVLWTGVGVGAALGAAPWPPLLLGLVQRVPTELHEELTELVAEGRLATVLTYLQRKLGAHAIADQFGEGAAAGESGSIPDGLGDLANIPWRAALATAYAPAVRRIFEAGGKRLDLLRHNDAHNLSLARGGEGFILSTPPVGTGMRADQALFDLIEEAVHTRTILYLGFRAHDPDFMEITRLLQRVGRGRRHYACVADLTEPEVEELLARYNIEVIPPQGDIAATAAALADVVASRTPDPSSRPEVTAALDLGRCVRHVDVRADFAVDAGLSIDLVELKQLAEAAGGVKSTYLSERARLQYGSCLLAHGELDEASRVFSHLIAKGASSEGLAIARFNMALVAATRGDSDVAVESFATAASERRSLALVPPQFRVESIVARRGSRLDVRCIDHASRDTVEIELHTLSRIGGPHARERFYTQLRALTGVKNPIIRRVKGGFADGRHFGLLCEPLDAFKPLEDVLVDHGGNLGLPEMAAVLGPVMDAIAQLHAAGLTHGNLHPTDILLTEQGPRIRGVGLAPVVDYHRPSVVEVSRGYASPEALEGAPLAPPADVFAMGALIVRVLTGSPALDESAMAKFGDKRVIELVQSALNRDPGQRPTMPELASRLHTVLSTAPEAVDAGGASAEAVAAAVAEAVAPHRERAERAESELEAARKSADDLRERVTTLEGAAGESAAAGDQASALAIDLEKARAELQSVTSTLETTQDELAGARSGLAAAKQQVEELNTQANAGANEAQALLASASGELAEVRQALDTARAEAERLEAERASLESALSTRDAELEATRSGGVSEIEAMRQAAAAELDAAKAQLSEAESALAAQREESAAQLEALRQEAAKQQEAQREASAAELEETRRTAQAELESERARLTASLSETDNAVAEIDRARLEAVSKAFEAGEQVIALSGQLEQTKRELDAARDQLEDAGKQAGELGGEFEATRAELATAVARVAELETSLETTRGEVESLGEQLAAARAELDAAQVARAEALESAAQGHQEELAKVAEELAAARSELEAARGELATEREAAAAGIASRATVPLPSDADDLEGWVYVLEHRPNDLDARDAIARIEQTSREQERWDRVAEVLRVRVELSQVQEVRVALLRELAEIYEHRLGAPVFAFETLVSLWEEVSLRAQVRLAEDVLRLSGITGRWSKGAELVGGLAERAPEDEDRLRLSLSMARVYAEELGAVEQANAMYVQAMELDAENVEVHEEAAAFLRRADRPVELAGVLVGLAELTEGPARHGHLLAAARLMSDQFEEHEDALDLVELVRGEDPSNPEVNELVENLARQLGRNDLLVEVLEYRATSMGGVVSADDLREAARLRTGQGDVDRTIAAWRAVLEVAPTDEEASEKIIELLRSQVEDDGKPPGELVDALLLRAEPIEDTRARMEMVADAVRWLDRPGLDESFRDRAIDLRGEIVAALPLTDEIAATAADAVLKGYEERSDWTALGDLLVRFTETTELDAPVRVAAWNKLLGLVAGDGPQADRTREREVLEGLQALESLEPTQRERLVALYLEDGDRDKAAVLMQEVAKVADTQGRIEVILEIARVRVEEEEWEAAESQVRDVLADRPESYPGWSLLLEILEKTERPTEAAEARVSVARFHPPGPGRAAALFDAGRAAIEVLEQPEIGLEFVEQAVEEDPDHAEGTRMLFERYVESGDLARAWPYAQRRAAHVAVGEMSRTDQAQLLVTASECALAAGEEDGAREMLGQARRLDATNMSIARVLADLDLAGGRFQEALAGYQSAALASSSLPARDRAMLYLKMGEACMGLGEEAKGLRMVERSIELDPDFEPGVRRLIELATDDRDRVLAQQKLLDMFSRREEPTDAQRDEELELLRGTAGFVAKDMKRPQQAAAMLERALELSPGDPAIYHDMLELHSTVEDWRAATEVLEKLAEMQSDPGARAKYLYAGAVFVRDNLREPDEALEWMRRVLEADPLHDKAYKTVVDLLSGREDWKEVSRAIRARMTALPENEAAQRVALLDELAGLYETKVNDVEVAYAAYEKAYVMANALPDHDQEPRIRKLYDLALRMGQDGYDKAIAGAQLLISQRPMDFETYHQLFELFLASNQRDAAICVARALRFLKQAEDEELQIANDADRYKPPRGALTPELWGRCLMHRKQSGRLTDLFATIWAVIASRAESTHAHFGLQRSDRIDVNLKEKGIPRMIAYSCKILDVPFPDVFARRGEPGDIRVRALVDQNVVYATLMLGDAALKTQDDQAWAFRAGRAACRAAPGMLMASVLPSGGGLKEVVFGSLLAVNPQFPVPAESRARSVAYAESMRKLLPAASLDRLSKAVQRVVEAGSLDTSAWLAGAEFTATRAGFVMADSLDVAAMIISKGSEVGNVPPRDLVKDLVSFSVSAPYLHMRRALKQDV